VKGSLIVLAACVVSATAAEKKAAPVAKQDAAADVNTPRADARKISFEARESTWMSVDVSPDGETVVFDLLGDIYSLPIRGGEATALTSGPAFDSQPRFSPDGHTIAFTSDRGGIDNIWLMDADGKNPRALTEEKDSYIRSATWTPDGAYLVARKEDGKRAGIPPVELWMYHKEGGGGIKLTSSDEINNASGPSLGRDGRYIYFSARMRPFSYTPDLSGGLWQIVRYDRSSGETFPVTQGFGGAVRPLVSPDGKNLVFVSRQDAKTVLLLRDLSSGAETLLLTGVTRDEQEGFAQMELWPGYAFTPDGRSILFSNHGKLVRLDLGTKEVQPIPFVAHVTQWAAPRVAFQDRVDTGPVEPRILRSASQSPDGRWVAYDALSRVWIQELAGGKPVGAPRRLTPDSSTLPLREYAPSFSPDGRSIAYVTWSDAEGGHVWKASLEGAPQKLTRQAGHYANPTWSPAGDRLAFVRGSGLEFRGRQPEDEEFFEIHWMEAAGGDTHYVTSVKPSNGMGFHPRAFFSGDGARLFYASPLERKKQTDDPKNDLVSVRLDGTDKKRHLRFPVVGDLVPSPDGQWVVFTSRDNVYVAALPPVLTTEPAEVSLKEGPVPVWRLSDEAGAYTGWTAGGKTITWIQGRAFHRLVVEEAIAFAREERKKKAEAGKAGKKGEKKDEKKDETDKDELKLPKSDTIELKLAAPRAIPEGSFVLKGARVITMHGDEVLENADVVVAGNRISAVGPSGKVSIPPGAKSWDAQGKTVIPGLIDTHAHMHYSGYQIFPDTKWEYVANLAYGVTTIYDPSAPSLDVFGQAELIEAGRMLGPRVYSSGDVLYGGQQEDVWAEVNSQADALRQVRRMKAYGARMIKVYQQPRRSQRLYFAQACRDLHMLLTAEGAGELTADLTMVTDGYTAFEHSLPVELQKDVVSFVSQAGTYYTPTLIVGYGGPWGEQYFYQTMNPHDDAKLRRFVPHRMLDRLGRRHIWISPDEYHFPTVAAGVAAVARAGGHVSLGGHGQLQGLGPHWELWAMAGDGGAKGSALAPLEALRAATLSGADKIGFAQDLGSIEAGKLADMVVLDENPLLDIHATTKIHWVIKNGEVFEADTMREVWPKEQSPPRFFWER
jgi:Tol biopolymer transport system component/imidazolonepropionase-like amidohydrolase